ncbi:MAG: hypothetical protein JWP51_2279, partial [Bradyrhizobium sp.]|nr:hypothetical protein [Bradyrhizobium sp.]
MTIPGEGCKMYFPHGEEALLRHLEG